MKVAVVGSIPNSSDREAELAAELEVPLIDLPVNTNLGEDCEFDFLIAYRDHRLVLQSIREGQRGELCVDFDDARLNYRAKSSIRNQNIVKALGVKGGQRPTVLDATAGLGKDAFLMASLGCTVTLLERSALIHALLADGLNRAGYYGDDTGAVLQRMNLQRGDLLEFEAGSRQFDVVYLDPMFPERRKRAKVKKDMAMLQNLLGHQTDGEKLLEAAKRLAKKRVVVKRAKLSPQLGSAKPDIEFKGSSSRYDVYLRA